MSFSKYISIALLIFIAINTSAQNKRFVEEVALYHLDSLSRTNSDFKLVQYYSKGFLISSKTSIKDTSEEYSIKKNLQMKSIFKDLILVENVKLASFPFSENPRKNKNYTALNIYHYLKINNHYFIFFDIQGTYGGNNILLVLDTKGDLVRYKLATYKN